jgi:hypothetical protein
MDFFAVRTKINKKKIVIFFCYAWALSRIKNSYSGFFIFSWWIIRGELCCGELCAMNRIFGSFTFLTKHNYLGKNFVLIGSNLQTPSSSPQTNFWHLFTFEVPNILLCKIFFVSIGWFGVSNIFLRFWVGSVRKTPYELLRY